MRSQKSGVKKGFKFQVSSFLVIFLYFLLRAFESSWQFFTPTFQGNNLSVFEHHVYQKRTFFYTLSSVWFTIESCFSTLLRRLRIWHVVCNIYFPTFSPNRVWFGVKRAETSKRLDSNLKTPLFEIIRGVLALVFSRKDAKAWKNT